MLWATAVIRIRSNDRSSCKSRFANTKSYACFGPRSVGSHDGQRCDNQTDGHFSFTFLDGPVASSLGPARSLSQLTLRHHFRSRSGEKSTILPGPAWFPTGGGSSL